MYIPTQPANNNDQKQNSSAVLISNSTSTMIDSDTNCATGNNTMPVIVQ